jgi:hypothetical protein
VSLGTAGVTGDTISAGGACLQPRQPKTRPNPSWNNSRQPPEGLPAVDVAPAAEDVAPQDAASPGELQMESGASSGPAVCATPGNQPPQRTTAGVVPPARFIALPVYLRIAMFRH